jgi:hypothetical protein
VVDRLLAVGATVVSVESANMRHWLVSFVGLACKTVDTRDTGVVVSLGWNNIVVASVGVGMSLHLAIQYHSP